MWARVSRRATPVGIAYSGRHSRRRDDASLRFGSAPLPMSPEARANRTAEPRKRTRRSCPEPRTRADAQPRASQRSAPPRLTPGSPTSDKCAAVPATEGPGRWGLEGPRSAAGATGNRDDCRAARSRSRPRERRSAGTLSGTARLLMQWAKPSRPSWHPSGHRARHWRLRILAYLKRPWCIDAEASLAAARVLVDAKDWEEHTSAERELHARATAWRGG